MPQANDPLPTPPPLPCFTSLASLSRPVSCFPLKWSSHQLSPPSFLSLNCWGENPLLLLCPLVSNLSRPFIPFFRSSATNCTCCPNSSFSILHRTAIIHWTWAAILLLIAAPRVLPNSLQRRNLQNTRGCLQKTKALHSRTLLAGGVPLPEHSDSVALRKGTGSVRRYLARRTVEGLKRDLKAIGWVK